MINNLIQISELLKFESSDDFYFLQLIKRKKENPELGSNNVVVKSYYITSVDQLNDRMNEIITICNFNNARAYINLNKRSFEQVGFQMLKKVTDCILNKDYKSVRNAYDSVCGLFHNEGEKKWIVDIDTEDFSQVQRIGDIIYEIPPIGIKVITCIPTKNGYHLISKPFDTSKWSDYFTSALYPDIHKNNPTILYIP